jgi:hypothetical protein
MCKSSRNRKSDSHEKDNDKVHCDKIHCIVYRDENYPTSWISEENATFIVKHLEENNGFKKEC